MLQSMTGFGQATRSEHDYKIQVDMKSVNHRYQETMIRMPREWMKLEDSIKKIVQRSIQRGRVDVFITIEREAAADKSLEMNWTLAEGYQQAAKQLSGRLGMENSLTAKDLLRLPDVVSFSENNSDADEWIPDLLSACTEEALQQLLQMRKAEGHHLFADMDRRLQTLKEFHQEIADKAPDVVHDYRDKLRQRIEELLSDTAAFDENRFAMEVAIMAERVNVDEELTRLNSHFEQCHHLLKSDQPAGRKLDFMIQEMNREVNTIGSKANDSLIVNKVVDMKAELEKIREQVQNVE